MPFFLPKIKTIDTIGKILLNSVSRVVEYFACSGEKFLILNKKSWNIYLLLLND